MRRCWPALLALALAAAAVAGVVVGALLGARGDAGPPLQREAVTSVAYVTPQAHRFGDRVVAVLEIAVNRDLARPRVGVIGTQFRPFRRLGPAELSRRDVGRVTLIRYAYALQCVDAACLPGGPERSFQFPETTIRYVLRGAEARELRVAWPAVPIFSHLSSDDLATPVLRAETGSPPSPSYSMSPTVLGWLLAGAAAVLVAAVAAVLGRSLRATLARPARAVQVSSTGRSPLEEALEIVEHAAGDREEDERRTALDRLARVLEDDGLPALSPEVRRLAWSEGVPESHEMGDLAARVRRALKGAA